MTVPANSNALLLRSAAPATYQVSRSLRFSSGDSSYLSRTPASAGNRKTWTWSGWVKRSSIGSGSHALFGVTNSGASAVTHLVLEPDNLTVYDVLAPGYVALITTQVFRDPSAWYHIVWTCDTTQATASNRMKLYVNGTEITTFSTDNRSSFTQNADTSVNSTNQHSISSRLPYTGAYFSGYLAEIHFIDGQALTPSSFAETDSTTGQWIPRQYSGSFGSQGWKLTFSDNSAATAAALGKDSSGNGLNWSPTNFSVTAGAGNDSLVDTPTSYGTDTGAGGEVRGNYCTWNPLKKVSSATAVNGNLAFTVPTDGGIASTFAVSSGKWYWEVVLSSGRAILGLATTSWDPAIYPGYTAQGWSYSAFNGNKIHNASSTSYGASFTTGDVIGVAFDADAGTLTFYKNGTSQGQAFSGITGAAYQPALGADGGTTGAGDANFGQRAFAYTAPSGFKALCDTNLPAPVVAKPSTVMDVKLYTGNGSTQTISGLGFSPDLVWLKARSVAYSHQLYDPIRGTTNALISNTTAAEAVYSGGLTAFNSDGFTIGNDGGINQSSSTFVAWAWDAGTSTATNTQGSINSQVRANTSAGFSIVTFTAQSSGSATVGHGLGVAPSLIITKSRTQNLGWYIYTKTVGSSGWLQFTTAAAVTGNTAAFGGVEPTSTVFTYGSGLVNTGDIVAYCFAPVSGYSSAFSYTGNGSSDGPMVYLGFRPRLIVYKRTDSASNWSMYDSARDSYNITDHVLAPNSSGAEAQYASDIVDLLSSGFKVRSTGTAQNASGGTYIGFAWAESPFQYARAR